MLFKNVLFLALAACLFTANAFAGSLNYCKKNRVYSQGGEKLDEPKELVRCWMTLPEGQVGQAIEVKDHYNYMAAKGKILKRRGRYVIAVMSKVYKPLKAGFPVVLKIEDSHGHWSATTAPF